MYRYRCQQCRTTSPPVATRDELTEEAQSHRDEFHGGHEPDDEQFLTDRPAILDLPREQKIAGLVIVAFFIIMIWYKHF